MSASGNLDKMSLWRSLGVWWWWMVVGVVMVVTVGGDPVLARDGDKIVCYYASWAHYRQGAARYTVQDVPVEHCTHVIYAFAVLEAATLTLTAHDSHLDTAAGLDNYRAFLQLRQRNAQVKLLLGLGGWTDSRSDKYSRLVSQPHHRTAFTQHVLDFLTTYGFDGLDLDWEFPAHHGPSEDKEGFKKWVEELRAAFRPHRLLLTAAVSAGKSIIDSGYDVAAVAKVLDQVHLMTYDLHGSWESRVANHAPLFPATGVNPELSVDFAVQYWMKKGAPADKLVLGVPLYGRSWTLSGNDTSVGAAASGAGKPGPLMKSAGTLAYYELCQAKQAGWKKVLGADGPYLTSGDQWVGYDDVATVIRKAQYVRGKGLGGVMLWDVTMDDFRGSCGDGPNPLIAAVSQALGRPNTHGTVRLRDPSTSQHSTHPQPPRPITTTTTTYTSTTHTHLPSPMPHHSGSNSVNTKPECHRKGYTSDPKSCEHFFRCVGDRVFHFKCPEGLHWRQSRGSCDWPDAAPRKNLPY